MQKKVIVLAVWVFLCWHLVEGNTKKQVVPDLQTLTQLVGKIEDNATLTSFVDFAKEYGKVYSTEKEMIYRLNVFKLGVAKAAKMNEESQKMGGASYGITKFSDITLEEFRDRYTMRNMPAIPHEKLNSLEYNMNTLNSTLLGGPPAKFDWRNHPHAVTGVYNQGNCGSCWAFSATENHESRFALQHHRDVEGLSVQQIVDCDDASRYGCNGGWPYQAWEYIEAQGGQDLLSCYPYVGHAEGCRYKKSCDAAGVVSWSWLFRGDEPKMLEWLWGNAPISICVDASQWAYYNGGIVLGSQCERATDHCVLLTGWNMDSRPASWNVRNSWGTDWGEGGYISLQYNANTCDMAAYPASCHTCNNCP